ncbi:hypothetical protein F5883DRAFT_573043 [Diaporthe sp. PMI_573]|nr:hypothetical protein F5883DRAFT_573043 [Diaporthaceae sp. PMI_573]
MVVSRPQYHIVGKVPLGHLQLGSMIDDLHDIFPLNENEELKLSQDRLYCQHEKAFTASREDVLKGKLGASIKAFAMQAAEVSVGGERGDNDTYKFGDLDTLYFYPTPADYLEAVKSEGLKGFLESSGYSPVYLVTGIKTGRQPNVELERVRKGEVNADIGIDTGTGFEVGPKRDVSKNVTIKQGSEESTDYIWAIKVQKLTYMKKWRLFGERSWSNQPFVRSAELVNTKDLGAQVEESFDAEELEIKEELVGYSEVTETDKEGEDVTWVVPRRME